MDYTDILRRFEEAKAIGLKEAHSLLSGWDRLYLASLEDLADEMIRRYVPICLSKPDLLDSYTEEVTAKIIDRARLIAEGISPNKGIDPVLLVDRVLSGDYRYSALKREEKHEVRSSLIKIAESLIAMVSAAYPSADVIPQELEPERSGTSYVSTPFTAHLEQELKDAADSLISAINDETTRLDSVLAGIAVRYSSMLDLLPDQYRDQFLEYMRSWMDGIRSMDADENQKIKAALDEGGPGGQLDAKFNEMLRKSSGDIVDTSNKDQIVRELVDSWKAENASVIWATWQQYSVHRGDPAVSAILSLFWGKQSYSIAKGVIRSGEFLPYLSRIGRLGLALEKSGVPGKIPAILKGIGTGMSLIWNLGWSFLMGQAAINDFLRMSPLWDHIFSKYINSRVPDAVENWVEAKLKSAKGPITRGELLAKARVELYPTLNKGMEMEIEKLNDLPPGLIAIMSQGSAELPSHDPEGIVISPAYSDKLISQQYGRLLSQLDSIASWLKADFGLDDKSAQLYAKRAIDMAIGSFANDVKKIEDSRVSPISMQEWLDRTLESGYLSTDYVLRLASQLVRNDKMFIGWTPLVWDTTTEEDEHEFAKSPAGQRLASIITEAFVMDAMNSGGQSNVLMLPAMFDQAVSSRIGWPTLIDEFRRWMQQKQTSGILSDTQLIGLAQKFLHEKFGDFIKEVFHETAELR